MLESVIASIRKFVTKQMNRMDCYIACKVKLDMCQLEFMHLTMLMCIYVYSLGLPNLVTHLQ